MDVLTTERAATLDHERHVVRQELDPAETGFDPSWMVQKAWRLARAQVMKQPAYGESSGVDSVDVD